MVNCLRILWTRHFRKTYTLFQNLVSYLERQHFKIKGTLLMERTFLECSKSVSVRMLSTQEQSYCDIIQSISVCDPWGYGTETAVTCSRFQDNVAPDLSQANSVWPNLPAYQKRRISPFWDKQWARSQMRAIAGIIIFQKKRRNSSLFHISVSQNNLSFYQPWTHTHTDYILQ